MNWLSKIVKTLLLATVLTPLIATPSVIFPYTFGKITFLRGLVLLALALTAVWFFWDWREKKEALSAFISKTKEFLKSWFGIFFSLTAISFLVSAFLAVDKFIAFWGDVERGEGVFGIFIIGIFLLLAKFWFENRDWLKFWWGVWGVGILMSVYGFLEHWGLFGITQLDRINSFVGNAGVLATYLVLIIPVGFILWPEASKLGRRLLLSSVPILFLAVFLADTRGVFLGLIGGALFLLIKYSFFGNPDKRFWPRFFLATMAALALFFGFTKSDPFWQKIPVMDRLSQTSLFSVADPSTATRLITWRLSWEAFQEKPIFGWGPEHFITAYERHYDPEFATYGETWIDRAHNQFLDVLVSRGVFGFILWLGLLAFLFFLPPKDWRFRFAWLAVLIAYAIQSLFIFDTFISYWFLAAFLAFWLPKSESGKGEEISWRNAAAAGCAVFGLAVLAFSYFSVWLPFRQAKEYREASKNEMVSVVVDELKKASQPYTFAQPNMRIKTVDTFYLDEFFYRDEYRKNPKFQPLADVLIENMREVVNRHGNYDVRYSIQLVEVLNAYAREDKNIYKETEQIIRSAIQLSPKRLELYYHLAFSLAGQGRTAEAVEVARSALALNPRAPRSHFSLALMLAADGKDSQSQSEIEELLKVDRSLKNLLPSDKKTLGMLYSAWNMYEQATDLALRSLKNIDYFGIGVLDRGTYEDALRYLAAKEKSEDFLLVADYLKKFPDLKEDMEILSDLVRAGNWTIIHSLK